MPPPASPLALPIPRLKPLLGEAIVRFRVCDPLVQPGQGLCVSGAVPGLGHWQQSEVMKLTRECGLGRQQGLLVFAPVILDSNGIWGWAGAVSP